MTGGFVDPGRNLYQSLSGESVLSPCRHP